MSCNVLSNLSPRRPKRWSKRGTKSSENVCARCTFVSINAHNGVDDRHGLSSQVLSPGLGCKAVSRMMGAEAWRTSMTLVTEW